MAKKKSLLPAIMIRKTFRYGPFGITLSPSGISLSFGAGPARVRVRTDGTVGVSASKAGIRWSKSKKFKRK